MVLKQPYVCATLPAMGKLYDNSKRYGSVTQILHWGMAALFAVQFASAGARVLLSRDHAFRKAIWEYHTDIGITLFLLVMIRGAWGLINMRRRPPLHTGIMGRAALFGHALIYLLMVVVPGVRILASAGSERGMKYFGMQLFPARNADIGWTQVAADWHGELGWFLAILIVGHIFMAICWHRLIKGDETLSRMLPDRAAQNRS